MQLCRSAISRTAYRSKCGPQETMIMRQRRELSTSASHDQKSSSQARGTGDSELDRAPATTSRTQPLSLPLGGIGKCSHHPYGTWASYTLEIPY